MLVGTMLVGGLGVAPSPPGGEDAGPLHDAGAADYSILYCTVLYCTILYYTILYYNTLLYYNMLY